MGSLLRLTATGDGPDLPFCCAIGRQIQGRRALLSERDLIGRRLVTKADGHWRLTVVEASGEDDAEALITRQGAVMTDIRPPAAPVDECTRQIPAAIGPARGVR
jgi:hypothetical protein